LQRGPAGLYALPTTLFETIEEEDPAVVYLDGVGVAGLQVDFP
jgi:hypothetical protein